MPITIKKTEFKKLDKKYRRWTVITAVLSFALTVMLFIVLRNIDDSVGSAACITLFTAYALFFLSSLVTLKKGVDTYRLEDNVPALFQSIIYAAVVVFCLMNLRFAIVFLLEGIGRDEAAQRILGSQTNKEFILSQYRNWICMLVGMTLSMIMGVLGGHKLAANS